MLSGCLIKYKSIQTVLQLYSCFFFDCEFTSVVSASSTYSVITVSYTHLTLPTT